MYVYSYIYILLSNGDFDVLCEDSLQKKIFDAECSAVKSRIAQYTVDVLERNRESVTKREKVPSINTTKSSSVKVSCNHFQKKRSQIPIR